MTTNDPHTKTSPVNGPTTHHDISTVLAREPCAGCGAPLGADQRYCLSCGIPRSGTRLPFLDVLHAEAASAGIVEQSSQPAALLRVPALASTRTGNGAGGASGNGLWGAGGNGAGGMSARLRENTGLFALLGVLLLALLIGLLLGHWAGGGSKSVAAAPAKQIVEVKSPQGVAAAPAAAGGTGTAGSSAGAGNGGGTSGTASAPSSSGVSSSASHASHASNPTVSTLAKSTGKEHAKAVEQALSKGGGSLSTGGAPPPKETSKPGSSSKPIGAGSEVTSIE
jgi:hypothetical protein